MDYETNDKGLSLLRGCLDELPKERKATIAGDMGELKRELRQKVIMVLVMRMVRMVRMVRMARMLLFMIMSGSISNI